MDGWSAFLQQLLGEEPRLSYFGQLGQQRLSPRANAYYNNNYADVYNEYLGQLGQQIMGGQEPTLQFQDFLSQSPFSQRFANLPPSLTGRQQSQQRFNPLTQWRLQ